MLVAFRDGSKGLRLRWNNFERVTQLGDEWKFKFNNILVVY